MESLHLKNSWYLRISDEYDKFCKRVDDEIEKHQQRLKACKKRNEMENKLAQELKLKAELTQKLSELSRKGDDLDRLCTTFGTQLTIAERDQHRLDNAKLSYELAKELTGVRLDFSATADVCKGYVKNEARRLLQPFDMKIDSDALWSIIQAASDPTWPVDKENYAPNK